jgi:hypothetical protein
LEQLTLGRNFFTKLINSFRSDGRQKHFLFSFGNESEILAKDKWKIEIKKGEIMRANLPFADSLVVLSNLGK